MLSYPHPYLPHRPLTHQTLDVLRSWRYFTFITDYTYKCFLRERRLPDLHPYVKLIRLRPRKK